VLAPSLECRSVATNRMRSVRAHSEGSSSTAEGTFARAGTGTSEPSGGVRTAGNVLDTISREEASTAIAARAKAVLRQARVRPGAWAAFAFLLERAYDALIRSARETGILHVRASLEAWATYVNAEHRRGKRVKAKSIAARFSEHVAEREPIWYGDREDRADGLRVEVAVVTPGKHGKNGAPGTYGLQARITRGGQSVRVERANGHDVLGEEIARAVETRRLFDEEVAELRATYNSFLAMGSTLAAHIAALAKRKRGIDLKHHAAMLIAWIVIAASLGLVGCAGYVAYRLIRPIIVQNETSDGSLPERMRVAGGDVTQDATYEQRWTSDRELVITVRDPQGTLRDYASSVDPRFLDNSWHREWHWRVQATGLPAVLEKYTEHSQLRIIFDRPRSDVGAIQSIDVHPHLTIHALHPKVTVGPEGTTTQALTTDEVREALDEGDVLDLRRPPPQQGVPGPP
jgi:hypothetical protein